MAIMEIIGVQTANASFKASFAAILPIQVSVGMTHATGLVEWVLLQFATADKRLALRSKDMKNPDEKN